MSIPASPTLSTGLALPGRRTVLRLFAGGAVALVAWEIWARLITTWVLGGPLEPPQLVISLAKAWTGLTLSLPVATAIHYAIGIVGYPLAYWAVSRHLPRWGLVLDAGVWLAFTVFMVLSLAGGTATAASGLFWLVVTAVTATRAVNPSPLMANCLSWGAFTWFNALGIFAPLAGLPFLLMEWGGGLSFMSYVGHIVFGFVAALVFETLEGSRPGLSARG